MADTRQDTVVDGLKKLFPTIAQLQLASDAQQHMPFIQGLMGALQKYIVQDAQKAAQGAQQAAQGAAGAPGGAPGPMGGPPGMGGPAGGPPSMTPPMAGGPMAAPNQVAPGGGAGFAGLAPNLTNMDEIRRMLNDKVGV